MPPQVRIERRHRRQAEDRDEQEAAEEHATGDPAEDMRLR
jgi:hypothetical protein